VEEGQRIWVNYHQQQQQLKQQEQLKPQLAMMVVSQLQRHQVTVIAAVLNLFQLADHLTNIVSVRGPPKHFYIFSGKFLNL